MQTILIFHFILVAVVAYGQEDSAKVKKKDSYRFSQKPKKEQTF